MKKFAGILLTAWIAVLLFAACQSKKSSNQDMIEADSLAMQKSPTALDTTWHTDGDSLIVPDFAVKLSLTEKAEKMMTETNESLIVSVFLLGNPIDTTSKSYMDIGYINLGTKNFELQKTREVLIKGIKIHKDLLKKLVDPDFDVLINVYSGRRSSEFNLISGGFLQETISSLRGKTSTIPIRLIEEDHVIDE